MIKNLDRLNPIKRDQILKGLQYVERINTESPVVQRVIVFGSVIREDCTADSDVDLCLVPFEHKDQMMYHRLRGGLMDAMGDVCDILSYPRLNDSFKEVVDAGVIVYER